MRAIDEHTTTDTYIHLSVFNRLPPQETADSDRYDRRTHDRLNEQAVRFAEQVASKYSSAPLVAVGWSLLELAPPNFEFVKGDAGYSCTFDWFGELNLNTTYRWATVPGLADGFSRKTPADASAVDKKLTLTLPTCDLKAARFTVTNLLTKTATPPPAYAETEPWENPPEAPEDDWVQIPGELTATRTGGDSYVVLLPMIDVRLAHGCEVRIVDQSVVDEVTLLPEKPADDAYEITVRIPDCAADVVVLAGLEVKAAAPVAKVRPTSQTKPPIAVSMAHSQLRALGYELGAAAPNGSCYPLSVCALTES
jgi:hypothetical protein